MTKESCRELKIAFYKPTSCPYLERALPQGSGNHSFMQFLGSFRLFMNFSALLVHLSLQPGLDYCQALPDHQFDAKVMKIWQLVVTLPISNTLFWDVSTDWPIKLTDCHHHASPALSFSCWTGGFGPQVPLLGHGEALETWNFVCGMQLAMKKPLLELPNLSKVARTRSVYHKYLF